MALPATLHRFKIQLSDVDRGIYQSLELRVARHPSESVPYLLTRVVAYLLNLQEGLAFSDGLCNPDEPALWVKDLTGVTLTWIEVGNPSARRLHKAAKAAKQVRVYTYRDFAVLAQELAGEEIYRKDTIEVFALAPKFLEKLGETLGRDNAWEVLHDEGELSVTVGDRTSSGEVVRHNLP